VSAAAPVQLRARARRWLLALAPRPLADAVLGAWRRAYWWWRGLVPRRRNRAVARRLVASGRPIRLELGSWKRAGMEDWIACDRSGGGDLALDLTEPLPFPDASVARIYTSHVLEHFAYPSPMLDLLRECHRVLVPGGDLSVAVPDARLFIQGYLDPEHFDRARFCDHDVGLGYHTPIDVVNFVAYLGGEHKHLFDGENLCHVLGEAGFREVRLRDFDPSLDLERRRHGSVYAVALK